MHGFHHNYDGSHPPFPGQSNINPFPPSGSLPQVPLYQTQTYNVMNPTASGAWPPSFPPPTNVSDVSSLTNPFPISGLAANEMPVPDGLGSVQYPPPNPGAVDSNTGFCYDTFTRLHYDSSAGHFVDSQTKTYLRWEPNRQTYLKVDHPIGSVLPKVVQATPDLTLLAQPPLDPLEKILLKSQEHRKAVDDEIRKILKSSMEEDKKASKKTKSSKKKKRNSPGRKKDIKLNKKKSRKMKSRSRSSSSSSSNARRDSPIKKTKPTRTKSNSKERKYLKKMPSSRTPDEESPRQGWSRSPSPRLKQRSKSPSPRLKGRSKSPFPRLKRRSESPFPRFNRRSRSPPSRLKGQSKSPPPKLKRRSKRKSPPPKLKRRSMSPSPRLKQRNSSSTELELRRSPGKARRLSPEKRKKTHERKNSSTRDRHSPRKEQSPKRSKKRSPGRRNLINPKHQSDSIPTKKHLSSSHIVRKGSNDRSRLSRRDKQQPKRNSEESEPSENRGGEKSKTKSAVHSQDSDEEKQSRENSRLKSERDFVLPKRTEIKINFDLEEVICPKAEPAEESVKMARPLVTKSESPVAKRDSRLATTHVGGDDDDLSMLDQYEEILDYGDSDDDEGPTEPAAMGKPQIIQEQVGKAKEKVDVDNLVDEISESIDNLLEDDIGNAVTDQENVVECSKSAQTIFKGVAVDWQLVKLAIGAVKSVDSEDSEASKEIPTFNWRRRRQRLKRKEQRKKALQGAALKRTVTEAGFVNKLPQKATSATITFAASSDGSLPQMTASMTNISSVARSRDNLLQTATSLPNSSSIAHSRDHLPQMAISMADISSVAEIPVTNLGPSLIQTAEPMPATPVLREMSPTLSALVDDNASISDCEDIVRCDEVEAISTRRDKFVFENILKKAKPSTEVLITAGSFSQSSNAFEEGIGHLLNVHQSLGWLIPGRFLRVSYYTGRSQPFPYATFHFSSIENAKAWFNRWNGVLPESRGIQYYAFYADKVWKCPHCQLKNFHLRRVCYFCCRLRTNGASPIRLVAEVSRWVAVTQAPHDVTEDEMLRTLKKFEAPGDIKLRNIKDPYTKRSCGLFIIQTSMNLSKKLFSWASAVFPVGTVSYCVLASLGFRDYILTTAPPEDPGGYAIPKPPFIQLLEEESKMVFAQKLDEPVLIVPIFSSKVGGVHEKFKTALTMLFDKPHIPFSGTICNKVECGAPHDYALLRFPSHEAAVKRCWSERGELTFFYGKWEDNTTVTCDVYFSRGNWICRDCKFALNYPLRSICRSCGHPKEGFKRPVYKVEQPTRWVAVFGVSADEDEKSILEDLKLFEVTLSSFKTFHILIDPVMKTSGGICLFETVSSESAVHLQSKLQKFFPPEEVHYVGVNKTYLEESSTLCRGTAQ